MAPVTYKGVLKQFGDQGSIPDTCYDRKLGRGEADKEMWDISTDCGSE